MDQPPSPSTPPASGAPQPVASPPARPRLSYLRRSREINATESPSSADAGTSSGSPTHEHHRHSGRETIESVVIAFVLAFLFRTFEAEAFVIPTGSMAPTLMGRHKEIDCNECGYRFTVSTSDEVDEDGRERANPNPVVRCVCPNCRFVNEIRDDLSYRGDRILVLKALYDLPDWVPARVRDPHRFDVVVFRFPEKPQTNYIKRLIGLPGETVRIHYGNIYTRNDAAGDAEFELARKSPEKQRALRMLVYDNHHQPRNQPASWPARWQAGEPGGWNSSDGRAFEPAAKSDAAGGWSRLEYHHLVRKWGDPDDATANTRSPREQLVTDFYGYNTGVSNRGGSDDPPHWVGDLTMSFTAEVLEAAGRLRVELVEAGERFACEFNLADGTCELKRIAAGRSREEHLASARSVITKPGRYTVAFANVDDRLTLWVNDKLPFGDGFDYDGPGPAAGELPTEADLRPVTIAAQAARLRVSDLVLYRDIYYTHHANGREYPNSLWNDEETWSMPSRWQPIGSATPVDFTSLGPDDFMLCGDNSPKSSDGREWNNGADSWLKQLARERERSDGVDVFQQEQAIRQEIADRPGGDVVNAPVNVVRRQLLIGRAFFVYWPHGVPFGPYQKDVPLGNLGSFRVPFRPYVSRMKLIQ